MHPAQALPFEFVIGSRAEHFKADSSRKLRSFLSRRSWQAHRALLPVLTSSSSAGNKGVDPAHADAQGQGQGGCDRSGSGEGKGKGKSRGRRRKLQTITFEGVALPRGEPEPESEPVREDAWRLGQCLSMDAYFGGIRVDPFRSSPGTWQPHIPALHGCIHSRKY
ncbi:hypothetical protein E4U54_005287 [Claviceps lovelessii]|nr:hypothetical protein E4U54_005287 [Claviceps lovelessii]